ncbi:hypothetical protein L873DRAFT_1903410 [Choiromyces venosus 120613-1]|uniref:Uncharacterized protein n=1 Tax=Choiromyces venosus 120613-1 TaxID=1336337 RepID=A0A3N4IVD5_9PEZI|nr:hypothetical protein L873DRAFT_1903410 [Choiromyces venosus 120613-1]
MLLMSWHQSLNLMVLICLVHHFFGYIRLMYGSTIIPRRLDCFFRGTVGGSGQEVVVQVLSEQGMHEMFYTEQVWVVESF